MRKDPPPLNARERVARNIIYWREKRGLSQFALAENSQISQTYISQIENGLFSISIDKLEKIAEALQIDVADLLKL